MPLVHTVYVEGTDKDCKSKHVCRGYKQEAGTEGSKTSRLIFLFVLASLGFPLSKNVFELSTLKLL